MHCAYTERCWLTCRASTQLWHLNGANLKGDQGKGQWWWWRESLPATLRFSPTALATFTGYRSIMQHCLTAFMGNGSVHCCIQHKDVRVQGKVCLFVCCLLNVPASCECISGTDLHRQFYVLPHWDRSCRSNFPSHPVTVYWHRADQSQRWPYNARRLGG